MRWCDLLAQQDSPPVAQHGEIAELMPGVGLGKGFGALGDLVARENGRAFLTLQGLGVQSQRPGQRLVENHELRCTYRHGVQPDMESFRQPCVAVIERPPRVGAVRSSAGRHGILLPFI